MRLEDFNRLCEEFFQKEGKALVRQSARIAIWEQLQKCNRVFIVSASIYNWIKPFASDLGIRDILSTEIEVDGEGCLTGFFSNKNCYGQEKVVRLLEQIPEKKRKCEGDDLFPDRSFCHQGRRCSTVHLFSPESNFMFFS